MEIVRKRRRGRISTKCMFFYSCNASLWKGLLSLPVELELVIIFNIVSTFILKTSSLPTTLEIGCQPPKYLQPDTWDSHHDELMGERATRECFHENNFTKH